MGGGRTGLNRREIEEVIMRGVMNGNELVREIMFGLKEGKK